jgi:tape measure domain-containing protein
MADASKTVAIIFEGENKTGAALAGVEKGLSGIGDEAGDATTKAGKLDDELEKIGGSTNGIDAATRALKALAASLVAKAFLDANVEFEKFDRVMTVVTGSTQGAAQEFEYIKGVADRLGLEILSTAEAYGKFAASAKGTTIDSQEAKIIFEAIAGTMSRLGSSAADVSAALVQLSQGVGKNRFELEDLKSIADRIPGFFGNFAESLGKTTDELYAMISAGKIGGDEMLAFSKILLEGLGSDRIDGYTAAMNRLKNAINEAFIDLGKAGLFEGITRAIDAVTATLTGAVSAVKLFGESLANIAFTLSSGDFAGFGDRMKESVDKAAGSTRSLLDAILGTKDGAADSGAAGEAAGKKIKDGMGTGADAAKDLGKQTADVQATLKALGVDPKKIKGPIDDIIASFEALAQNPAATGSQILAGLKATLKDLKDNDSIAQVGADIVTAFAKGKLTATEFADATKLLDDAQDKLAGTLPKTKKATDDATKGLEKSAAAAEKAKEKADSYRLEMEKLASNERIKNIEARVAINVAQLQADAEKVKSTFASIDNTVNSTGELLGELFKQLGNFDGLSWAAQDIFEAQIEGENRRRDEALNLQKKLTEAQIEQMRAQTQALLKGDAMIKIDGAGLQPHLEAFMWEILRTIQVRVNRDGLAMLLGT